MALVTCSEVIEDRSTNNKTLVSLFSTVNAFHIPGVHARMSLFVSLMEGEGRWPMTILIRFADVPSVYVSRLMGGEGYQPVIHTGQAMVLTYDCEFDKTNHVLIAELRPLTEIEPGSRGHIRRNRVFRALYVAAQPGSSEECCVDFRRTSRLPKAALLDCARVASAGDDARSALQGALAVFFGVNRAAATAECGDRRCSPATPTAASTNLTAPNHPIANVCQYRRESGSAVGRGSIMRRAARVHAVRQLARCRHNAHHPLALTVPAVARSRT